MKNTIEEAALEAGRILEEHFGKKQEVEHKKEKGLVSIVDKKAEEKILSILLAKYNYNVIAEETGNIDNGSEYCWVIDPLDGTTNYLKGIPFFCVSIALLKNNKPYVAVIYQPLLKELFYAEYEKGVYLNGNKIEVSNRSETTVIDCNLGYSDESVKRYLKATNRIVPEYPNIRNFGSSALELAYLAAGRLDCFLSFGDELYDVAAGILLAQEAGCIVSNWEGNPWNIEEKGLLVASPELHARIKKHLQKP